MRTTNSVRVAGSVLREKRHARDISRKALAAHAAITPQRLSDIELEKKPGVQHSTFVALATGLGLPEGEWGVLIDTSNAA